MDLPESVQWLLFTLFFLVGGGIEFLSNNSFLYPCLSETVIMTQATYLIAFYWMMFNETETSKYIIIAATYATHLVTVA